MPLPLLSDAFAVYACAQFGNDTAANKIWERLDSSKDLTLGDGSTSSTFPTFTTNALDEISYYLFDGVDDYIDDWPIASGSGYFVSAALSDGYPGTPYITQVTDDSLETLLTTAGAFGGCLHSLIIFETEPTTAQKKALADYQLRALWQEQYVDPYVARLIRDGECVLYCDFEHPEDLYNDYSGVSTLVPNGQTWDYALVLGGASTEITIADTQDLRLSELSFFFSHDGVLSTNLVEKSGNYALVAGPFNLVQFQGVSTSSPLPSAEGFRSFALTAETGQDAIVYNDGVAFDTIASGTIDDSGTADVIIGDGGAGHYYRMAIFNRILTPDEIKLLHTSALLGHARASDLTRAVILDVDGDDEITGSQTNVVINCLNAGATEGKIYITESDVFADSEFIIEQSVDSWTDTSIQFDVTGL